MARLIKYLFLSLLFVETSVLIFAGESLYFKGDYFIYSDDLDYIYGSGKIVLTYESLTIRGDIVYFDIKNLKGVIYGDIHVKKNEYEKRCNALFFRVFPLEFLCEIYLDNINKEGIKDVEDFVIKKSPDNLKKSALYYEFREFKINKDRKIKAKKVIPFVMGLISIPLKKLTIKRGKIPEKTMLYFKNINYSELDGVSLSLLFRLRNKLMKGDYDFKFYDRKLFKNSDEKRGVLVSGQGGVFFNKNKFLDLSAFLNSGDKSFNLTLSHKKDCKYFSYSLSQNISGREHLQTFFELSSNLTFKKMRYIQPTLSFTHNLKSSYAYKISTPLNIWKKMNLNIGMERKILRDNFRSDMLDISTSLKADLSLISLSSDLNFAKDMLEESIRKNFSVSMNLKPLLFLDSNVSIDISSFYMFSELPYVETSYKRITPGVNVNVSSSGILLPAGFVIYPSFIFNQVWNNKESNSTNFNHLLSIEKELGKFRFSLDYSLISRYKSENFWVEGYNSKNINVNFEFKNESNYSFYLKFYFNDNLALENISLTNRVNLPFDITLSSFFLFYKQENKFQSIEIFIEKKVRNKIKIQGGYSLALKRFFLKFLVVQ